MDKIGFGIIGAGIMGEKHARVFSELPYSRVVAVADLDEKKAKRVAVKYGGRNYSDYKKLLEDPHIRAVCVATPDFLHFEPVIAALDAGKDVLVEKPLATSLSEARKIVEKAKDSKSKLMVNYTHRWAAPYANAMLSIKNGDIGEAIMAYARKNDTLWVPTEMMNWADKTSPADYLSTHDIDLVRWFFKSEIKLVYAQGVSKVLKKRKINTEDAIQAAVKFENGAIATFESAWIYPDSFPTPTDSFIELVGTEGVIHIDRKKESVEISSKDKYSFPKISLESEIDGSLQGGFRLCLEYFLKSILEDRSPEPSAEDGLKIVEIVEAIHQSLEKEKPITLRP